MWSLLSNTANTQTSQHVWTKTECISSPHLTYMRTFIQQISTDKIRHLLSFDGKETWHDHKRIPYQNLMKTTFNTHTADHMPENFRAPTKKNGLREAYCRQKIISDELDRTKDALLDAFHQERGCAKKIKGRTKWKRKSMQRGGKTIIEGRNGRTDTSSGRVCKKRE